MLRQWFHRERAEAMIAHLQRWELQDTLPTDSRLQDDQPEEPLHCTFLRQDALLELATAVQPDWKHVNFVKGFVQARDHLEGTKVEALRQKILKDYSSTVFCGKTTGSPPIRGEFGEAEINLQPGVIPVKQRPFQMTGERRAAWVSLTDQLIKDGKIEPGNGPWCSPSFPVPKKKPGTYRLVVDFRRLNEATIEDSHPLPRIGDILQRQGQYRIWSVLDMKDGYHQVPLKQEHRNLTCMTTPRGIMRWRVLVMGLRNGNAIFQRVMEEVLQAHDNADAYVDDVIVGSNGDTEEELLTNHYQDLVKVLESLQKASHGCRPWQSTALCQRSGVLWSCPQRRTTFPFPREAASHSEMGIANHSHQAQGLPRPLQLL